MSVIDFFRGPSAAIDSAQWWQGSSYGGKASAGVDVTENTAMTYSAVANATTVIAEAIASLPAIVYRETGNRERERAIGDPLYRLLHDMPNPEMDSFTFYELMTSRLVNQGNAYAEIERTPGGNPVALWPIDPWRVRPFRIPGGSEIEYHVDTKGAGTVAIGSRNMLNVVGRWSKDGITAPGVIPQAKESIGTALASERYVGEFFGEGAQPPGVIQHPGKIKPEARANIRRDWNSVHAGPGNWQNVAVLSEGMQWQAIGVSPEQAQLLESRRFNIKVISQWYNIAPAMLQDYSESKFSTVEAQLKHFIMFSVRPWAVRWERALGRQIFGDNSSLFVEFVMNALLRGDPKTQADTNSIKLKNGALSQDEWRAQDNENPLPNGAGAHYWLSTGLQPVEHVLANPDGNTVSNQGQGGGGRPTSQEGINGELAEFSQRRIDDVMTRMIAKESNSIKRKSSSEDNFVSAVEDFYRCDSGGGFSDVLESALAPLVSAWCGANKLSEGVFAKAIAVDHCRESIEGLLLASECSPDQLSVEVEKCTAAWFGRRIVLSERL